MKAPYKYHEGPKRVRYRKPDREWLEHQYHTLGKTQKQIAQEVGCYWTTVKNWVREFGLHKDRADYHYQHYEQPAKEWLERQYLELDKSVRELAEEIGCTTEPVVRWLRQYNITKPTKQLAQKHSKRMTGRKNPAWIDGNSQNYQRRKLERSGLSQVCQWCGTTDDIQIHHIDHDRANHALSNLTWLCGPCNRLEGQLYVLQQQSRVHVEQQENQLVVTFREV